MAIKMHTDPAQEPSATQRAYLAIRRMILIGDLPPGEKLKIEKLRSILEMGGSPIREALTLLVSDLLVERLDQRGFRTAEISPSNFAEILNLRCHLEEMALRESLSNADHAWEDKLVITHHRMMREPRTNVERFEELHKTFHMNLLNACHSPVLLKFCNQLYDLNIRYRYLAGRAIDYSKRDIGKEHTDIMNAAVDRDADAACRMLLDHYRNTGAFLEKHFSTEAAE
ncbi:MAG: GntR family transcriptional regulator [Roseibium album]|uniref:Carbon starvation induced regulator n=1 Tax=Roseibium album TaxID=311410 RepID=A0A0M6ZDG3_9HYPH|nr:GntR family transcriptional regulator [Roseibium album]CTQ59524.1 Carbon starvation induced regulator [Roseibium album]CTQ65301.1 Carbon starvation induced regulator [Roseibium album]CTQ75230.1 Carbon starvation induced regulator [Roseibium album]